MENLGIEATTKLNWKKKDPYINQLMTGIITMMINRLLNKLYKVLKGGIERAFLKKIIVDSNEKFSHT